MTGSADASGKFNRLFTLNFTLETTNDTVLLRYSLTDRVDDSASSHVAFQTVAISPIPEVTSTLLFGLSAAAGLLRRRR